MKFLILDGNSIFSRAFYGIKNLSNKNGQMTNGIYGFLLTLNKLLAEVKPDRVAVAFDLRFPTFRHKMYENYKGNRHEMPDDMVSQFPILKDLLGAMGYKMISIKGYEADDILGTFAKFCEENNYECVLATGDRDILQLVSKNVSVRITITKFGKSEVSFYNEEKVKEEYGVEPQKLVDIKALQGDASDNIPGIKGIGKKTAKDLIVDFGTVEEIYKNLEFIDIKPSLKEKLIAGKEFAKLSYSLGKIMTSVPFQINEQDYIPKKMDQKSVKKILTELEFFTFIEKMNFEKEFDKINFKEIYANDALNILKNETQLAFLPYLNKDKLEKIFICVEKNVYSIDFESKGFENFISTIINNPKIEKIIFDYKSLNEFFKNYGINIKENYFDVMLAAYITNPSEKDYSILKLGNMYEVNIAEFENIIAQDYKEHAQKVYTIFKLKNILENKINQNSQMNLLKDIEQPFSEVLANMEKIGFLVDKLGLENFGKEIEEELKKIQKSIYSLSGEEFNINSPKQLGFILFEKLKLPFAKKSKTGYSTNAEILDKLKDDYEIVEKILQYRSLGKLKSTYCDGIVKLIDINGRVHSSFNQTETKTGRISSSEPNLQNIPIRTEKGRILRKFFKAPENCVLIDADYSQIELRVLAHVSQDENMINAFKNGQDIHKITASQIMNVPLEEVTSEMRFKAKAINFGIIYGMSAFSLAKDLNIDFAQAQTYIIRYLAHYSGIDKYMENIIKKAKKDGFVETIFKRRRYLQEINSSNFNLRGFGERVARNMPIQGAAADIIKIAMINIFEKLKDKKSKIILQVHDEIIIESPLEEASWAKNMLKTEMENAVNLLVPLKVNIEIGETWYEAKD